MKDSDWVYLFLYMFLVYLVVHAFSVSAYDEFNPENVLKHDVAYVYDLGDAGSENSQGDWWNDFWDWMFALPVLGGLIKAISQFFNIIITGITFGLNLLTFNIASPEGLAMPIWLTWIPLLMVLIPWIIIVKALLPKVVEVVKALPLT